MKLAVSCIAWAPADCARAYRLLRDRGITGLEIAPGLFLPGAREPTAAADAELRGAVDSAAACGLQLVSMQSLLFGVEGAALFESEAERQRLEDGMARVAGLAARLAVPNLVFGSPGNRVIPPGMDQDTARTIWLPSFRRMGRAAEASGAHVALEPNPERYGTNFMTSLAETAEVVRAVDHPAVRLNLDLGALILTGEIDGIESVLPDILPIVAHVHLSAPDLAPLDTCPEAVRRLVAALAEAGWQGWVSVEMRGGLAALPAALDVAQDALEASG